jgi:hypothetical protein
VAIFTKANAFKFKSVPPPKPKLVGNTDHLREYWMADIKVFDLLYLYHYASPIAAAASDSMQKCQNAKALAARHLLRVVYQISSSTSNRAVIRQL